jgi:hypothetical protein
MLYTGEPTRAQYQSIEKEGMTKTTTITKYGLFVANSLALSSLEALVQP